MTPTNSEKIKNESQSQLSALIPVWLKTENEFAKGGTENENISSDPDYQLTRALLKDWDAKKAEALTLHNKPHPLQVLRTLIQRGHFQDASKVLDDLRKNLSLEANHELVELLLEEARLSCHDHQFKNAEEICNQAIQLDPPSITLIALLQVRALAFYEMSEFKKSLSDIETMGVLSRIFPAAPTLIYAEAIRIKILARIRGLKTARNELSKLWASWSHNPDSLLTLLRTEIDLRRLENRDFLNLIPATYWLSEKMGDRLYAALAFLDFYTSKEKSSRIEDQPMMNMILNEFPKVQKIYNEIQNSSLPISTTAATMANSKFEHRSTWPEFNFHQIIIPKVEMIIRSDGSHLSIVSLVRRKQLFKAVESLKNGQISKAEFFSAQWGRIRYVPFLHDGLIRTLICRIRKEMKLNIESKAGHLIMEDTCLVSI